MGIMLDKVIRNHVEKMEDIEVEAKSDVIAILDSVSIDEFVDNTENIMKDIVADVRALMTEKYSEKAVNEGLLFAKTVKDTVKKDKEIKVPDTEDPNLNKDIKI